MEYVYTISVVGHNSSHLSNFYLKWLIELLKVNECHKICVPKRSLIIFKETEYGFVVRSPQHPPQNDTVIIHSAT